MRIDEGMVISKAPRRLRPKAMKRAEMKPLTHGLDPSATTPNGAENGGHRETETGEQHDDAEAEDDGLHDASRRVPIAG